jgi:hypothetical protein
MATPIRQSGGKVIAVLALGTPVEKGFASLFSAARLGQSGEALAFDAEGWLLSESRHAEELQQRGLAPRLAAAGSERANHARRAARRRAGRGQARRGPAARSLSEAISGATVIGAWRWLPEHDIGVAVEMRPARPTPRSPTCRSASRLILLLMAVVWLAGFLPPKCWPNCCCAAATRRASSAPTD